MKVSAISDVHVKNPGDEAEKLLIAFLNHKLVQDSDYIFLMGDIFDLMCGPHDEYLRDFGHLFDLLLKLEQNGAKIFFFEGNHDVHLKKLFAKHPIGSSIRLSQDSIVCDIGGKKYYVSHGDEHEVDNLSYQRYKKFIFSPPLRFVANHLLPYCLLNFVGKRASQKSRKRGSKSFDAEKVKERFRTGAMEVTKGEFDFVLGGHSHVQDQIQLPGTNSVYLNNGYALNSKTFIYIEDHRPRFVPLA
jgi:UDP-2,3-diacylglucosamine hydrolase